MAGSLKDALIKAGVVSKDSIDRQKENARREKIQQKGPSQEGIHAHHIRTDCANCGKNASDVEYYEHSNRSIEAKWLCMICADKAWIKDECRQTNQSSHAKAGKFRREFGATKRFAPTTPAAPQASVAHQQSQQSQQQFQHKTAAAAQSKANIAANNPKPGDSKAGEAKPGAPGRVEFPPRQFPKRRK